MTPEPETTPPNPENLFLDLLATSVAEARESSPVVASPHEAYALLHERLDLFWRGVQQRQEPEVLLDLLIGLATQCVAAGDDLFVARVIADNDDKEVA